MKPVEHAPYWSFNIEVIEEHYKARFIAEIALKQPSGNIPNFPFAIFKQEKPPEGMSEYLALFMENGQLKITSGAAFDPWVKAITCIETGEILYSRFRHDYVTSIDGQHFIDGGLDYIHCNAGDVVIEYNIETGEWRTPDDKIEAEHEPA